MTDDLNSITERLEAVRGRISTAEARFERPAGSVTLLAVSKKHPAEAVRAAAGTGQRRFGESYAQEAVTKIAALADLDLEWHFIGPLQSNKTRDVAAHFDWVHSLDRLKLARRLSEQRPAGLGPLQVCLQLNVSGEVNKAGCQPHELPELARAVSQLPNLQLRGLMTIPARSEGFDAQRRPFRLLRQAFEQLRLTGFELDTLSMGMSADLEAAVAEGATIVRVGTDVFGARQ